MAKNFFLLRAVVPDKVSVTLQKAPSGRLFYYWALNAAAVALAMVSWLNPNHYPPWVVFENEAAAFAAVFLAGLAHMVRGRRVVVASGYLGIALCTLFVILGQYGMGMVSWQLSGLGILYIAAFALCIVVGYGLNPADLAAAESFENTALLIALLAAMVSSWAVLGQWLRIESYYPLLMSEHGGYRPYGNLGQPNNQGTLLVTGVLCVELLLRKNAIKTSVAYASLLILLPAIAATGSRTAVLSSLAAATYLFVFGCRRKYRFTVGWLLVLLVCFVVLPEVGGAGGTEGTRISANVSDSPRLHIYKQLVWAIFDKPWTGYGWMQTAYAQSLAAEHVFGGVETDYAHNVILDVLVWCGIPLGSMLLLAFGFVVFRNWQRVTTCYKLAYVLFLPLAVHSLLEFPFAYAFFLLPAATLLGYLGQQSIAKSDGTTRPFEIGMTAFTTLLVLTVALATVVCVDYLELAEDFRVLRFENRNVGKIPEGFRPSTPIVLTDLAYMMEVIRYKPRPGQNREQVAQLRRYVLRAHNPGAHVKLISQAILDNELDNAASEIRRFQNLYGTEIRSWGMDSLFAAYCEDLTSQQNDQAQQICCALSEKSQCSRNIKLRN